MKKLLQVTALSSVALVALPALAEDPCLPGGSTYTSGTYQAELPFNSGIERTFRVHVPKGYDPDKPRKAPLVLIFHGWGGDENEFLDSATVTDEADRRGFILVAPRGLGSGEPDQSFNSWSFLGSTDGLDARDRPICDASITPDYSYQSCGPVGDKTAVAKNTCSWTHCQSDDIIFALNLVEQISHNLCVAKKDVFAVGGSNGGMYTWNLGQDPRSAKRFRAISALIGLPHRGYLSAKAKKGNLPALAITGTQDTVVPPGEWEDPRFTASTAFGESYFYTGATGITRSWAKAHGCSVKEPAVPFEDHGSGYDCRTYCDKDEDRDEAWPRVLDCRAEMGHEYDFDNSWELIMDFFHVHSARVAARPDPDDDRNEDDDD